MKLDMSGRVSNNQERKTKQSVAGFGERERAFGRLNSRVQNVSSEALNRNDNTLIFVAFGFCFSGIWVAFGIMGLKVGVSCWLLAWNE